jgi:hypothetical protein
VLIVAGSGKPGAGSEKSEKSGKSAKKSKKAEKTKKTKKAEKTKKTRTGDQSKSAEWDRPGERPRGPEPEPERSIGGWIVVAIVAALVIAGVLADLLELSLDL